MNKYELAVVVSAKIEDEARTETIEKVKEIIARFGGNVTDVDEWGKRRLAYEIQKMKEGFYYFIHFESDSTVPAEVESRLRIMENVIRFLCIRQDAQKEERGNRMNKVILMGRLTRDPEVRYSQGANATAVARYSLAVDRRFKRDGEPTADFINCVSFGRSAEFAEKYFRQGLKVVVTGRIQTGSYTNKDGVRVYTTDVVVEEQEFAESKAASENSGYQASPMPSPSADIGDGFMNIPDGIDEELPFS